jgi:PKD repeat protein
MEPTHVYITAGTYNVSLTIVDTMGATNTVIKPITVNPLPTALFSIETPSCEGNPVQFHDHSTTQTGFITEWLWDFGDGNTTTVVFPNNPDVTYTYAATGTYIVTLTITNSDSCSNSTQNQVTTISNPMAMFTSSSGCASGPVSFTDTSIENGGGTIITWNWNFDDPASGPDNTSTLQNPIHQFSSAGDYDVQLIITNINGCSDTTESTVTVADQPEVEFNYSEVCLGSETQFTVDGTVTNIPEVQTWSWAFGDGGTSNLQNPSHTYAATGDYDVTLAIVTTDGCTASVTHEVRINPLPNPNFAHTGPVCLNDTVYFTDLSSSPNGLITTWHWDFGDGTEITINAPDSPDVSHIYTNDATFAVTLTVTDSDTCENLVIKNVEVVPSPIADYTYEETCYDEPVFFTDLSTTNGGTDIMSWEWFFGDPNSGTENTSTLQNPTHVFTDPGTYTTTLIIVSTLGCNDTTEQDITIDPPPDVDFTILDDSICLGESAEFTGISTSDISTWFWDFGDGGSSIEQNPTYMYSSPGTYIVTLTVTETGADACQNSISYPIYVNDAPEANFDYQNNCLGDSTYFTDLSYSQMGFITGWDWDFGDGGTSTQEDPTHYYQNYDTYQVTLISTDNYGCSDTIVQMIQVFDVPVPGFTFDQVCDPEGQVNFFDESEMGGDNSPIVGWNWNLYEGYYSTEIDPSYIYPYTDTCYTVILEITDSNGCIATDTNTQVCLHGTLEIDFTSTRECLGTPTFFTASYDPPSDSIASYTWNFNDGSPLQATYHDTISHIFPNPTTYIVELVALDTNGCSISTFHQVTVDSLPTPRFTNTTGSCSTPTQFTDISFGGGEFIEFWRWDFGDIISGANNTSTLQNPTHLYGPYDSTYQVKLTVTNFNGCTDSIVQDVYVEPCLIADFGLPTGNNCARYELCFTDTSQLSSNNGVISQWLWNFGDGNTYSYNAYQNPICHTYADGGDYQVQLIIVATINGTSYNDTVTKTLTVHPTPVAGITVMPNCFGDSTMFYDNTNTYNEPLTMWHWDFGDSSNPNDTSIIQNPAYLYPTYGTYDTELKVMNQFGCRDSITTTVDIYKPPEAAFSFAETCMSYYTYFTDESIDDSSAIIRYNWNFGDTITIGDTSNLQDPTYIYDTTGNHTVVLIVTDGNQCYDTISHNIEIYPIPTSGFIIMDTLQQGRIYLDNISIGAISYYWDFDYDYGQSSTEEDPTHQYEVDGSYTIMLVSYNDYDCPDTTYQVYDLLFTNLFVPNAFVPSNSNPELRTFKPIGINLKSYRLEVYSAWGNLVFESTALDNGAPAEGWDGTYENKALPTGSYIWRISALFEDGKHWKGTDNGDGNTATSGTVTLIR